MKTRILTVGILAVALAVGLLAPATAQSPVSEFDTILADRVVATADVTAPDVTVSDDLAVSDAVTAGSLVVAGQANAATLIGTQLTGTTVNIVPGTAISMTQGMTLTPTSSLQPLTASGNRSTGIIADGTAGRVVTFINTANVTLTISDTGNLRLSGDIALGQYDTLTLAWITPNWHQVATSNN